MRLRDKEVLELLLNTYLEMVKIKSKEPGECSHMLAFHTEFIKKQINLVLKRQAKWSDHE